MSSSSRHHTDDKFDIKEIHHALRISIINGDTLVDDMFLTDGSRFANINYSSHGRKSGWTVECDQRRNNGWWVDQPSFTNDAIAAEGGRHMVLHVVLSA